MSDIWTRVDEAIDTDPLQLRDIVAEVLSRAERAEQEAERLRGELATAREERDLAIAHDRQPYPTAWAYEQACKALETQRQRAEQAEAERDAVLKTAVEHAEDRAKALEELDDLKAERDAAHAAIRSAFKRLHSLHLFGATSEQTNRFHREILATLQAALDAPSGADSHQDARTPVPPDAEPPHPPHDAQEAATPHRPRWRRGPSGYVRDMEADL
ncbi:hypothetical protein NE236_41490 [Actinoallomurus purpureus]|uniref:hypothetical protein n=1 Tax=Actinoallomurus purpureus TaxID=478114 RepID=UPI002092E29D|nr:hypothetical protein [Actinoallomurus purpureus]MCO6011443.1 hypothetical protein [Actinoallomurus purpureus]